MNKMEVVNRHRKITAGITISLCTLLIAYLVTSIYFTKHLYFGSKINGSDVSGKTVEEIKSEMTAELNKYTLTIKERGGKTEQIKASDINLKYMSDEKFKNIKDGQKPLKWGVALFSKKNYDMSTDITYDKKLLAKNIDSLNCLAESNITEPKEPSIKYSDNGYVIVDEVKGNKINKDAVVKLVEESITKKKPTIDLESANCYINPKFTSKSEKVVKARDMLNKYVSSKITYTFVDNKETLDSSKIKTWVKVDENFDVTLDEEKISGYVRSLGDTYNTYGKTRSFRTSSGNTINVSGGDYGWQINISKEVQALSEAIKSGQTITKEPAYSRNANSHGSSDIGNTYVEVDMTKQHMWYYKNGSLVVQGDVVTGNLSLNMATPPGTYKLKDKLRNFTLKGQDYSTPVSFWMPFNGGVGIHDATWRDTFGGEIYKTNGSHGCVNSPYNLAETIFNNISIGTPVVCYY